MMPLLRYFASPEMKMLAREILLSEPCDWEIGPHKAYCRTIDITVWHCNQGYAFRVWPGHERNSDAPALCKGGPDGEALWHAYKSIGRRDRRRRVAEILMRRADRAKPVSASVDEEKG